MNKEGKRIVDGQEFFYNGWEQSVNNPHTYCIRQIRRSNRTNEYETNESETLENLKGPLVTNDRKGVLDI